jgi:uncharacterized protein
VVDLLLGVFGLEARDEQCQAFIGGPPGSLLDGAQVEVVAEFTAVADRTRQAAGPVWQDDLHWDEADDATRDGGVMPVFAVTTAKGVNWDHARTIRQQRFWDEHAAFADRLVSLGIVILGGPIASADDEDIALLAVEAADENAVQSVFDADPWTVHKVFRVKDVRSWTLWLDSR